MIQPGESLNSLANAVLIQALSKLSQLPAEQQRLGLQRLIAPQENERDKDVERKREKRSEAARIEIGECKDPKRREACLADPELLLRTYFKDRYKRAFDKDRARIISTIWDLAQNRGRKAMAAPRGRGKTELAKGMIVAIILAQFVRFPLVGGQTKGHGHKVYLDVRNKFMHNPMLAEDFPEICGPVNDLDGAPLRAGKQHINGELTRIAWQTNGHLSLPFVPGSPYGGVKLAYFGLDVAFRGMNIEGCRPDFIFIDDPETKESAVNIEQIEKREQIINQDIAGLAEEDDEIAIALFTTIQNRYCLSFRITDPEQSPAWQGERFGMIESWPKTVTDPTDESKLGLWSDYIAKRQAGQTAGDVHAWDAVQFYLDNFDEMNDGGVMIKTEFTPKFDQDGRQLTYHNLQVEFNKIADTNLAAYRTEYQNDPEEGEQIQKLALTAGRVQSRLSGFPQGDVPSDTGSRTIGIDLGKYACHWTDAVWSDEGCVITIPDYGIAETIGLSRESSGKAIEHSLIATLEQWADEIALPRNPFLVLIDSGTFTQAAYEFCRRMGPPFFPAKGWDAGRFKIPKRTDTQIPFLDAYARYQPEDMVWLYHIQGEAWKKWTHERFLIRTFDDDGARVPGSMALFETAGDTKRHLSFSHHITAEEEQMVPVTDKELKRIWKVKNRNNHWLDSTALAMAAGGCIGHRLVNVTVPESQKPQPKQSKPKPSQFQRAGRSFVASKR